MNAATISPTRAGPVTHPRPGVSAPEAGGPPNDASGAAVLLAHGVVPAHGERAFGPACAGAADSGRAPVGAVGQETSPVSAFGEKTPPVGASEISLSPGLALILACVAAHDRLTPADLIAQLVRERAAEIGLSRLARECLDRGSCDRTEHSGGG
jgi:hypothetical protein